MTRPRVVFMGSSDFAVPALERLAQTAEVVLVVTQPDKPNTRGGKIKFLPVKQTAIDLGIPVFQPEHISDEQSVRLLQEQNATVFVVAAYGQILKQHVLDIPPMGCLNIHGSVLPRYRGAAPVHRAIIDGCTESGVSIMKLDAGMDTGDVLAEVKTPITDTTTVGELHDQLSELGANLLDTVLPTYLAGEIVPQKQDGDKASYAQKITREEARIHWENAAAVVVRLVNGTDPFPGAWTEYDGKKIKLFHPEAVSCTATAAPGTVLSADKNGLTVKTGSGAVLFKQLQWPGKRRMSVNDFLKGNSIQTGILYL